jgi:hypothetical protein
MVGSTVRLPRAPQTKQQAVSAARGFLNKFVEDNKRNNPALSKLDLSTLSADPVRKFKDNWFVTFGQIADNPFSNEKLLVFGSEANVTISGADVIQFGLDLFPEIRVSTQRPPMSKAEAVNDLLRQAQAEQADTTNVRMVVFPLPQPGDTTKFVYMLAYQINVIARSTNPDQPFETWSYVVDAATGRTLFRQSLSVVQIQASGRVKAAIYEKSPEESKAQPAELNSGQIGNANLGFKNIESGGVFNFPAAASVRDLSVLPSNSKFTLFDSGLFDLFIVSLFGIVPANQIYQKPLADSDVTVSSAKGIGSEVILGLDPRPNTFYHLNRVRDYFIRRGIGDWLETPLKVSFIQGYPNAFYSGANEQLAFGSIADPLGLRTDVIYHEYTHGVVNLLDHISRCHGWIKTTADAVHVRLEAMDGPRYRAAQKEFCDSLNHLKAHLPNGKLLKFSVGREPT